MKDISILLAFSAGLLSFLSPCVLPLVPAYVSYLTGSSIEELKDDKAKLFTLYKSLGFVLGFSIIFILMGVSITSLGLAVPFILTAMAIESFTKQFKKFSKYLPIISTISGVLMIIMGFMIFMDKLAILSQYSNFINF